MIHLVTVIEETRLPWLPQFVQHYRALGVDRFLITLHIDSRRGMNDRRQATCRVEELLASLDLGLVSVLNCAYRPRWIAEHHNLVRRGFTGQDDWIVWADIDEFQEYPEPLRTIIRNSVELGFGQVQGKFLDRVADGGRLAPFNPSQPIWSQYPLGAPITRRILGGLDTKVVASRADLEIGVGQHFLLSESARVYPKEVTIHHFKWDASVCDRLATRIGADYRRHHGDWKESQRILEHIRHHGHIDLGRLPHVVVLDSGGADVAPGTLLMPVRTPGEASGSSA